MTIVSWLITLSIFYLYITKKTFSKLITEQFLNYAISVASFSAVGSLVYSEVVGFIPCKYCWYQRYLMYPIALLLVASLFKKSLYKFGYVSLFGFFSKYLSYLSTKWRRRWWVLCSRCSLFFKICRYIWIYKYSSNGW